MSSHAFQIAQASAEPPWSLATGTAAGVAVLMVVLFLRYLSTLLDRQQKEMEAQRTLFATTLKDMAAAQVASAERVEIALRDLAAEIRGGVPRQRHGTPT